MVPDEKYNIKKDIGQRIRGLRRRRGMTQEDMADRSGLHWTYIGGLERGERNPTLTTLKRISDGLSVTLVDLLSKDVTGAPLTPREKKEGRLLRMLRRGKDGALLDLATGLVRETIHWKDRYRSRKKST
jgi:transcriptional regulator with XRE-family HTH domain